VFGLTLETWIFKSGMLFSPFLHFVSVAALLLENPVARKNEPYASTGYSLTSPPLDEASPVRQNKTAFSFIKFLP
jgi:hypothetical protein